MIKTINNQKGQAAVLALIVLAIITINVLILIGGSVLFKENTDNSTSSIQAINLAEAGADKAVASLNASAGSYSGESETPLGDGTYEVVVTSKDAETKIVKSTGYIPNKTNVKSQKTVTIEVSKGVGVSFNYGIQTGNGGLEIDNNSQVKGSVYSNGNITMINNSRINGDAYVAGGVQPTADQQSDCSDPNCADFTFGKVVDGQSQLDVAESFTPSVSNVLNEVFLKLKKFGSPPDLTVRIMKDRSGLPDKNNIIASGTLSANLVGSQYGFVEVVFPSPPQLQSGTTYWIMLDTSSDNNNYWAWSEDISQGYNGGKGEYSANWQSFSPVWNPTNADLGFQTYMGGVATYISGSNGATITGDAHANTLENLSITKGAYYQIDQSISAGSYYPNSSDPVAQPMPISDSNINDWKNAASSAGVHTGNITSCRSTLPSGSYVGSVSLPSNCTITVGTPIWITGNFNLSNSDILNLDPSLGSSSGVIIVDGVSTIANNNKLVGSGTTGSFLILLSTYDSEDDPNHNYAINLTNNGNSGIIYTNQGNVLISNNNNLTEITAWKLTLANNVTINYDQGLAESFFSSGPSGSYSSVKGTYSAN